MIQLSLEFQLEKPQLPLEYERLMVSFLKVRYLKVTLYFLGTTDLKCFLQMLIWDRL